MYRELRPELIEHTVGAMHEGWVRHFPGSGLSQVACEILEVARQLDQRARWIRFGLSFVLRGSVVRVVAAILDQMADSLEKRLLYTNVEPEADLDGDAERKRAAGVAG